jgi:hypothetical protein
MKLDHPDDAVLLAHVAKIDGGSSVESHLAVCAACSRRVVELIAQATAQPEFRHDLQVFFAWCEGEKPVVGSIMHGPAHAYSPTNQRNALRRFIMAHRYSIGTAASLLIAALVIMTVAYPGRLLGAEQIIERVRNGPANLNSVKFVQRTLSLGKKAEIVTHPGGSLRFGDDPPELLKVVTETIYRLPDHYLMRILVDGRVAQVSGMTDSKEWSYDAESDVVIVNDLKGRKVPDIDRFDGAAMADMLDKLHATKQLPGEDVVGNACWVLEVDGDFNAKTKAESPGLHSLQGNRTFFIDSTHNFIRKQRETSLNGRIDETIAVETNVAYADDLFTAEHHIGAKTTVYRDGHLRQNGLYFLSEEFARELKVQLLLDPAFDTGADCSIPLLTNDPQASLRELSRWAERKGAHLVEHGAVRALLKIGSDMDRACEFFLSDRSAMPEAWKKKLQRYSIGMGYDAVVWYYPKDMGRSREAMERIQLNEPLGQAAARLAAACGGKITLDQRLDAAKKVLALPNGTDLPMLFPPDLPAFEVLNWMAARVGARVIADAASMRLEPLPAR